MNLKNSSRSLYDIDDEDIFKDALARAVYEEVPELREVINEFNKNDGAHLILSHLDERILDGKHWASSLASVVNQYTRALSEKHAKEIAKRISKR